MNTYMLIFVNNEIASCNKVNAEMESPYRYEQSNGRLVYAIINANHEDNARTIAKFIAKEVARGSSGKTSFI
jgi:hypothetical protein